MVGILTVSLIYRKQIKGKRGKKRKALRLLWPVANTAPHRIKLTVCISIARHLIKAAKSSHTLTRPFMCRLPGVLTYSNGWPVLTNKACDRQVCCKRLCWQIRSKRAWLAILWQIMLRPAVGTNWLDSCLPVQNQHNRWGLLSKPKFSARKTRVSTNS